MPECVKEGTMTKFRLKNNSFVNCNIWKWVKYFALETKHWNEMVNRLISIDVSTTLLQTSTI